MRGIYHGLAHLIFLSAGSGTKCIQTSCTAVYGRIIAPLSGTGIGATPACDSSGSIPINDTASIIVSSTDCVSVAATSHVDGSVHRRILRRKYRPVYNICYPH
jgi:hypothetical protein